MRPSVLIVATERDTVAGTALALTSVASVQTGAAVAALLFARIGPVGTVSLRLLGAALVLAAATRPWRHRLGRGELATSALFGIVFTAMNVSLYAAIDRLPLATVITLEFLGPLAVAVSTARSWRERSWALPAAFGVALLGGSLHADDRFGVAAALTAAGCWASYILLSRRLGRGAGGLAGLSLASIAGALVMLPVGAFVAGAALWRPSTLALGLLVGVIASAIPYSLDLLALRRLPTAVFGVLTSLNPAAAALAGLIVLGQAVPGRDLLGIAAVILAGVGVTAGARSSTRRPDERTSGEHVGVDVEDALAHIGPGIEDRPVGAEPEFPGRGRDPGQQPSRNLGVGADRSEVGDVLARDDQHVRGRLRVGVAKGNGGGVGADDVGRDVTGDDRAEEAVGGHDRGR